MRPPKPQGKQRELPPKDGSYKCAIVSLVDKGTQPGSAMYPDESRKIGVGIEYVEHETSDGKPLVTFHDFTFTDSPKGNLFQKIVEPILEVEADDENWDMDDLLGKSFMAKIKIKDNKAKTRKYCDIVSISQPGVKIPKPASPLVSLYLRPEVFDLDTFNNLPEGLRNIIATSEEYKQCIENLPRGGGKKKTAAPVKKVVKKK